jgi:stage II sporulation protein D
LILNLQGTDWFRILCLGVLVPLLLFLSLHCCTEKPSEPDTPAGTEPTTTTQQPISKRHIWVLSDGQMRQMELEVYLVGVVLAEMPASFEAEALRAQAVAARTYTIKHCMDNVRHGKNAICTDHTCCQAFITPELYVQNGGSWSSVNRIEQAVHDTMGLVLMYGGEPILATYFSCAGGLTEDAAAVWGQDIPYLQSVSSPGEEAAAHYTDSKTFTAQQLQEALCVRLPGSVDTWFGEIVYTQGGGVATIEIGGVAYRGTTIRTLLGLRSTAFSVTVSKDTVTFHTRGYGHRVGMSQYGANAMAATGKTFQQILKHYYTGAAIVHYNAFGQ